MTGIPDLFLYRLMHKGMRRSSARLHDAVASLAPGDARHAAAIARWYRGFAAELHTHHHVEDTYFFPALAERVPAFEHYGPVLDTDHVHLAEVIDGLAAALGLLADGAPWSRTWQQAVLLSRELADHLDRHLAVEDDDVLPLFERHFTAAEYEAVDQQAARSASLRELVWTVPWVMTHCDEAERAHAFASAPPVMRLVWRLSRGRYRRMEVAAFGPSAAAADPALAAA